MPQSSQEYTAAGDYTFNVPTGVSCVFVSAIAGGAGAGVTSRSFVNNGQSAAGGGAGESCDNVLVKVTSGGTLAVHVGAGGVAGSITVLGINAHAGPPGSSSFGAGFGGDDTIVGPLRLVGGYSGLSDGSSPHAGMGGGWRAYKGPSSKGAFPIADNGEYLGAVADGGWCISPNSPRHFGGAGGGTGGGGDGSVKMAGGIGGSLGPFPGGAVAVAGATCDSGGSGAASLYGPGGDGGDGSDTASANAPAVPAGSYGCGGGAPGGTQAHGAGAANKYFGAAGHDGYVILTWFEP